MHSKEISRGRDATESQRSNTSIKMEKAHLDLPSSSKEVLEIEQIQLFPIRRSFSKKRSISTGQPKNIQPPLPLQDKGKFGNVANQQMKVKTIKDNSKFSKFYNIKSKILNSIDLSIISESKNESKLETPQRAKINQGVSSKSELPRVTSFSKWVSTRKNPYKKDDSFSKIVEFSTNQICEASLNPSLTSFTQDHTFDESQAKKDIGFKDYISKSCKLLPAINRHIGDASPLKPSKSIQKKKNEAAKKILAIQALFAQKGIALTANLKELMSIPRQHVAQLVSPQANKEDSIVRFEASVDDQD